MSPQRALFVSLSHLCMKHHEATLFILYNVHKLSCAPFHDFWTTLQMNDIRGIL